MYSLVGYGSDDEGESERYGQQSSVGGGVARRKEDDTNYESVNMDMSEESQGAESEPELPQVDTGGPRPPPRNDRHSSNDSRDNERERNRERDRERERDKERARERERERRHDERASPRREERAGRSERTDRRRDPWPRRGLLGDRPDDRPADRPDRPGDRPDRPGDRPDRPGDRPDRPGDGKHAESRSRSQDMRDAVSPRFVDHEKTDRDRRERGDRDRERERDRDREGRSRRSEDRRSGRDRREDRSRSRGAAFPPPQSSSDRRGSPSGDYRPSSYKVSKKLEVMEKMGLQIKTPDGSMTTAQQLRAAAGDAPRPLSALGAPGARVLQQVQKRKLLWANKNKTENEAAKWSGTKFAQDSDGKQVSKFMRLMGIKDPAAINEPGEPDADPNKKQEELFQAMQAQYDVARATTHTMRGVGLGFQRSQF